MIVGKPMALLLMRRGKVGDATVTVAHSRSRNLSAITRAADIVIAAIGRAHFLGADHIGDNAVVIDVGINRMEDPVLPRGIASSVTSTTMPWQSDAPQSRLCRGEWVR